MPLWGFVLCFLTATAWAVSPIMINHGLAISKCTTNEVNPIRSTSFVFSALIIALLTNGGLPAPLTSVKALVYIVLNVTLGYIIGDLLYFVAIRRIGISRAVPVSNSYPIMVTFTSWMMLGEPITLKVFLGVAIVVAGIIALRLGDRGMEDTYDPMEKSVTPGRSKMFKGFLIAVVAALAWAIGSPIMKMALLESKLSSVDITFYRALVFLFLAWGSRFFTVKYFRGATVPLRSISRTAWLYFMVAAVIGLCLGSIMSAACLRTMPVAVVTAITATSPFIAALYGHFILKEHLYPVQWVGVFMIIAGSVTVSL